MRSRTLLLALVVSLLLAAASFAQVTQPKIRWVSALPALCSPTRADQALVYKYTATTGLYRCSAANTWTALGGGGGSVAIGGTVTSATDGSVFFAGASGALSQDNAAFFWDRTSKFLRVFPTNAFDAAFTTYNGSGPGISITREGNIYFNQVGFSPVSLLSNASGGKKFQAGGATVVPLSIEMESGQTANAFEIRPNGGGSVYAQVNKDGIFAPRYGTAVASAATISITGNFFHVTGTTNITSISGTGVNAGTCVSIIFDGILTLTDGSNLKMESNFVTTADDVWSGCYDGTNWYETARAVN